MVDKQTTVENVIAQIHDGATLLVGGWGPARKPMAFLRALARSPVKDLTVMSFAALDLDLLVGLGKVKKAVYGFTSFEGAPGAMVNFRRARQEGAIQAMELSEYMFIAGIKAAAERLPFYPTRSGLGTDILTMNPEIEVITAPYTGEKLVAVPALKPDIILIHVNVADYAGNARIFGDCYLDRLFVRAGGQTYLSAEMVVPTGQLAEESRAVDILSPWVSGVVECPQGAAPGSCYPDYDVDAARLAEYTRAAQDAGSFSAWVKDNL